jgi:hypothetical protein
LDIPVLVFFHLPQVPDESSSTLKDIIDVIFWKRWAAGQDRILNFAVAIGRNDVQRVRQMLAEGMNPNQLFSQNGERPLHTAAGSADREMIVCLVAAGADPLVGIRLTPVSILSPSGYAKLMRRVDNADYLISIENERRERLVASGQEPPVFSNKVESLCQRLRCSPPTKLLKYPSLP